MTLHLCVFCLTVFSVLKKVKSYGMCISTSFLFVYCCLVVSCYFFKIYLMYKIISESKCMIPPCPMCSHEDYDFSNAVG